MTTNTFKVRNLAGNRALITGQDELGENRKYIASTLQFDELEQRKAHTIAVEDFDATVEEFFAPIIEAAEEANRKVQPKRDPAFFEVIEEGTEGVEAKPEQVVRLCHDTVILRLIDAGNTDRLLWVGDTIEVLELDPSVDGGDDSDDASVEAESDVQYDTALNDGAGN